MRRLEIEKKFHMNDLLENIYTKNRRNRETVYLIVSGPFLRSYIFMKGREKRKFFIFPYELEFYFCSCMKTFFVFFIICLQIIKSIKKSPSHIPNLVRIRLINQMILQKRSLNSFIYYSVIVLSSKYFTVLKLMPFHCTIFFHLL